MLFPKKEYFCNKKNLKNFKQLKLQCKISQGQLKQIVNKDVIDVYGFKDPSDNIYRPLALEPR